MVVPLSRGTSHFSNHPTTPRIQNHVYRNNKHEQVTRQTKFGPFPFSEKFLFCFVGVETTSSEPRGKPLVPFIEYGHASLVLYFCWDCFLLLLPHPLLLFFLVAVDPRREHNGLDTHRVGHDTGRGSRNAACEHGTDDLGDSVQDQPRVGLGKGGNTTAAFPGTAGGGRRTRRRKEIRDRPGRTPEQGVQLPGGVQFPEGGNPGHLREEPRSPGEQVRQVGQAGNAVESPHEFPEGIEGRRVGRRRQQHVECQPVVRDERRRCQDRQRRLRRVFHRQFHGPAVPAFVRVLAAAVVVVDEFEIHDAVGGNARHPVRRHHHEPSRIVLRAGPLDLELVQGKVLHDGVSDR
mmetsp:Transcript_2969/g.6554  ORF Transcript_2969/g.6554 Transcript_2969/m.6554 type:complete len:348 (+) Transcript_2969:1179-2222(+)